MWMLIQFHFFKAKSPHQSQNPRGQLAASAIFFASSRGNEQGQDPVAQDAGTNPTRYSVRKLQGLDGIRRNLGVFVVQ
jgi:hypothetical protein